MSNPAILFLRLEGPLQSWGLRARWDVRDSGPEPSKSGLIGLLGCALGYGRNDPRLEIMDRQLMLGIRVEKPGDPLVDFHTITGTLEQANGELKGSEKNPATVISPRTYLQDAAFLAVFAGPEDLLRQCGNALQNPRWPIFLGRKSCPPTRPVFEELSFQYESIRGGLTNYPWDWEGRAVLRHLPEKLYCIIEDAAGSTVRPDRYRINPARMYAPRQVSEFWVDFPETKEASPCISPA